MFNIYHFYSNDLEIFLSIILIVIFAIIIYDRIKAIGKLHLNIIKPKLTILNKDSWSSENKDTTSDTKALEFDFTFQLCNQKNTYNNIYNLEVGNKKKPLTNSALNLTETLKSLSGATTYEKLKYVNLLPYEVKEYRLKIKLTKDEYLNLKKQPIYIKYYTKNKKRKINLTKYLKNDKK